ncbi:MAG: ATP synthase F1 subunit gamma [Bdellovibrionota bacterium]|nr:MAG: ATP synthase F1 subunit gamma [Bdellovibrionota bacterium]
MPGTKEIRRRLISVRNTKKITYAMKLVSAAKLRRAQESVTRAREYTTGLQRVLASVQSEAVTLDFVHPLMQQREVKRVALVVIGGSRGLCGSYNSNVHRKAAAFLQEWDKKVGESNVALLLLGKKPGEFFRRVRRPIRESWDALPEDATKWPIDEVVEKIEIPFLNQEFDEVYVLFTEFRSAISQVARLEKLLPLDANALNAAGSTSASPEGNTLFEPSAEEVFSALVPRMVRAKLRQAALDAKASEHGARMTSMENATKNAGELGRKLELLYNKLRQGGITAELLDIVGGAEAMK